MKFYTININNSYDVGFDSTSVTTCVTGSYRAANSNLLIINMLSGILSSKGLILGIKNWQLRSRNNPIKKIKSYGNVTCRNTVCHVSTITSQNRMHMYMTSCKDAINCTSTKIHNINF